MNATKSPPTVAALVIAGALVVGVLAVIAFTGCCHQSHAHLYACPMKEHSDALSDQPGDCAKCGMKLVEKK